MADILFAPVTGAVTERVRCPHIACDAPHAQKGENPGPTPGVTFTYEIERDFGGDRPLEWIADQPIGLPYDPNRLIYLRNPLTNEFLGQTMTWQQVFVALFSAALDEKERAMNAPSMVDKPATPTQQAEQQAAQEGLQQQLGEAPQG